MIRTFPYTELRTQTGDYFDNRTEMARAGFLESQMWSVVEATADDGSEWLCYGPVHHYINLLGYIATAEHHNGGTYYEECIQEAEPIDTKSVEQLYADYFADKKRA